MSWIILATWVGTKENEPGSNAAKINRMLVRIIIKSTKYIGAWN